MSDFRLGMSKTWKSDGTPLTVTDSEISDMVMSAVAECFPQHSVLTEEAGSSEVLKDEYVWICDPIDGTVPFSHGVPTFVFSLALVHNGRPILGVVNDPTSGRLYVAWKGKCRERR